MNFSELNSWNEYDWERELRKDDARIQAYIKELPDFIDLPDEDELLIKRMQQHTELIPQEDLEWLESHPYSSLYDQYEDIENDFTPNEEFETREGDEILTIIQQSAYFWCKMLSRIPSGRKLHAQCIRIICLYGKLTARITDIINMEVEEYRFLKIALCKRSINEINSLHGELRTIQSKIKHHKDEVQFHMDDLQKVRVELINLLYKTKMCK